MLRVLLSDKVPPRVVLPNTIKLLVNVVAFVTFSACTIVDPTAETVKVVFSAAVPVVVKVFIVVIPVFKLLILAITAPRELVLIVLK